MSDIRLIKTESGFDIALKNNDLEVDEGLETAIIISLFTDRRVSAEELSAGQTDRRGWWADAVNEDGDLIGSKLWLLQREKITAEMLIRAREYCEEALKWLVDDGIAEKVFVQVKRIALQSVGIAIQIKRPSESKSRKYDFIWRSINSIAA